MPPLLDVDLKQVAQIVHARAALSEPALLLDARRLCVPLRDNQPAQLIAELSRTLLPHRLAEEIAEPDSPIVYRIREKDAPAILRQLDVFEVCPPGRIHADRR